MIDFIMWWWNVLQADSFAWLSIIVWGLMCGMYCDLHLAGHVKSLKGKPATKTLIFIAMVFLFPIWHIVSATVLGYGLVELTNQLRKEWKI